MMYISRNVKSVTATRVALPRRAWGGEPIFCFVWAYITLLQIATSKLRMTLAKAIV